MKEFETSLTAVVNKVAAMHAKIENLHNDLLPLKDVYDKMSPLLKIASDWNEIEARLPVKLSSLRNVQEPCDICSGYGCPDYRDEDHDLRAEVEQLRAELLEVRAQVCVILACQECSKSFEQDGVVCHFRRIEDAREVAEGEGWRRLGSGFICGDCVDKPHVFVSGGPGSAECLRCDLEADEHEVAAEVAA